MKLVTHAHVRAIYSTSILIHTSVKLVTLRRASFRVKCRILIHTSVKLVTLFSSFLPRSCDYFNPHEREARDAHAVELIVLRKHFNPHEREARDGSLFLR